MIFGHALQLLLRIYRGLARRCRYVYYYGLLGRVGQDCQFGRDILIQGHGSVYLGRRVTLNEGVVLQAGRHAKITLGDGVVLSFGAMVLTGNLAMGPEGPDNRDHTFSDVFIDRGAWIGARAIILPGIHVGPGAVVAAGSVVTKSVPARTTVAGNPAQVVRTPEPLNI